MKNCVGQNRFHSRAARSGHLLSRDQPE
jgi:hypothetical protein